MYPFIYFLIQISFKETQNLRVYLRNCIYFNIFRDILIYFKNISCQFFVCINEIINDFKLFDFLHI